MRTPEARLRAWLRGTGAIYALGAVDFVARPKAATASLSHYGGDEIEPEEPPGLYNSLAAAYMATIAALALSAAQDPGERRALIPPLLVAKGVSSGLMLYRFTQTRKKGFALGAALDAFLFGVTAGLYSALD
ncbi:MAG: hypothetical protein QOG54_1056 [Actinomycetota bacterium]|nr:hypothetical protein [Actinomycetota bacterium]